MPGFDELLETIPAKFYYQQPAQNEGQAKVVVVAPVTSRNRAPHSCTLEQNKKKVNAKQAQADAQVPPVLPFLSVLVNIFSKRWMLTPFLLFLQRKESSKKGKLAKLDPANSKTILDIQEVLHSLFLGQNFNLSSRPSSPLLIPTAGVG